MPLHEEPDEPTHIVPPMGTRTDWRVTAIVGTVAALLGLGSGYVIWGGNAGQSRAHQNGAAVTAPSVARPQADEHADSAAGRAAAAVPATRPDEVQQPDERDSSAAPEPAAPAAAKGDCQVSITSTPSEAKVRVGRRSLGVTPITMAMPCGDTRFRISRRRYQATSRRMTLVAGEPAELSVKLDRPTVKLSVSSTPRGAEVSVDGKVVGKTPATVEVDGYVRSEVTITKKGYKPYKTTIYPKSSRARVKTRLAKKRRR